MSPKQRILILDDEEFIRQNLQRILKDEGYAADAVATGDEARQLLNSDDMDLVLLDLNLGQENGLDLLRELKEQQPELLVIVITGYATVESAVEALKLGAYDYIKKPFKADAIRLIVKLALETRSLRRSLRYRRRHDEEHLLGGTDLVGSSPQLLEVARQTREVAQHGYATVLVTGESGTGKELVA